MMMMMMTIWWPMMKILMMRTHLISYHVYIHRHHKSHVSDFGVLIEHNLHTARFFKPFLLSPFPTDRGTKTTNSTRSVGPSVGRSVATGLDSSLRVRGRYGYFFMHLSRMSKKISEVLWPRPRSTHITLSSREGVKVIYIGIIITIFFIMCRCVVWPKSSYLI